MTTSGLLLRIVSPISSRFVSQNSRSLSENCPMRSARSLICFSDSSPDIYSTSCPSSASFWHTCKSRVDFPMPGSPPTRTREPGTIPPPSTRSSSCIWVVTLSSSFVSIEERQTGPPAALLSCAFAALFFSTVSSTKVFHSLAEEYRRGLSLCHVHS